MHRDGEQVVGDRRRGVAEAGEPAGQRPVRHRREGRSLGVRRISVGGTLARTAWAGWLAAAQEIADEGSFGKFQSLPDVNAVLEPS